MGELIAVLSGKGGTGKTSLCAAVATALAAGGARVLCIDCDVGLRNLDLSLGLSQEGALSFLDLLRDSYGLDRATAHPQYPTLRFLTAPVNCQASQVEPLEFSRLLQQARGQFQYVFLDAPAGVEDGFRLAARYADRILLVTGADPGAVRDARRTGDLLEQMGKTDVRLVVNRVNPKLFAAMGSTVDDIMDSAGLPLLGIVPEDANVPLSAAFGKPLQLQKRSAAARACRRIAQRIQGRSVPVEI